MNPHRRPHLSLRALLGRILVGAAAAALFVLPAPFTAAGDATERPRQAKNPLALDATHDAWGERPRGADSPRPRFDGKGGPEAKSDRPEERREKSGKKEERSGKNEEGKRGHGEWLMEEVPPLPFDTSDFHAVMDWAERIEELRHEIDEGRRELRRRASPDDDSTGGTRAKAGSPGREEEQRELHRLAIDLRERDHTMRRMLIQSFRQSDEIATTLRLRLAEGSIESADLAERAEKLLDRVEKAQDRMARFREENAASGPPPPFPPEDPRGLGPAGEGRQGGAGGAMGGSSGPFREVPGFRGGMPPEGRLGAPQAGPPNGRPRRPGDPGQGMEGGFGRGPDGNMPPEMAPEHGMPPGFEPGWDAPPPGHPQLNGQQGGQHARSSFDGPPGPPGSGGFGGQRFDPAANPRGDGPRDPAANQRLEERLDTLQRENDQQRQRIRELEERLRRLEQELNAASASPSPTK